MGGAGILDALCTAIAWKTSKLALLASGHTVIRLDVTLVSERPLLAPAGLDWLPRLTRDASARLRGRWQGRGHFLETACPAGLHERTAERYFLKNLLEHRDPCRAQSEGLPER